MSWRTPGPFYDPHAHSDVRELRQENATLRARVVELERLYGASIRGHARTEFSLRDAEAQVAELSARLERAREVIEPFAKGSVDVSGSAIIIGWPEAIEAYGAARNFLKELPHADR